MRQNMTDDEGRPIYSLSDWTMGTSKGDDVVVMSLRYQVSGGQHGEGSCPHVALTPVQATQLAGALQACVMELKGATVTPIRGRCYKRAIY